MSVPETTLPTGLPAEGMAGRRVQRLQFCIWVNRYPACRVVFYCGVYNGNHLHVRISAPAVPFLCSQIGCGSSRFSSGQVIITSGFLIVNISHTMKIKSINPPLSLITLFANPAAPPLEGMHTLWFRFCVCRFYQRYNVAAGFLIVHPTIQRTGTSHYMKIKSFNRWR